MNYQVLYCKDLDAETLSVTIIEAISISDAVNVVCKKLGITEAHIMAVILLEA